MLANADFVDKVLVVGIFKTGKDGETREFYAGAIERVVTRARRMTASSSRATMPSSEPFLGTSKRFRRWSSASTASTTMARWCPIPIT